MSNRISFDSYTGERKDGPAFPAPPEHALEAAPPTDDVLTERIRAAESEGRWNDALVLKGTAPQPVRDDSADARDGNDDGGDDKPSGEWGVSQWDDKSGFFEPTPSQIVNGSTDDGDGGQGDDTNDDSNDGEDDQ